MLTTEKKKNFVMLGIIMLVSVWLFIETFYFEKELGVATSTFGSAFFPRILLGIILLLCIALAVQTLLDKKPPNATPSISRPALLHVLVAMGVCLLFALIWDLAGFLVGAGVFAVLMAVLLRPSVPSLIAIAVFIPTAWFFFTRVFMVSL